MLQIYSQKLLSDFFLLLSGVCVYVCVSFALFGLPNTLDESRPNGPPSVFGKHCKREGKNTPEQDFWNDREASLDGTDVEFLRRKDKLRSPTPSSRSFRSQWIPQASVQIMFYTHTQSPPHPVISSLDTTGTQTHTSVNRSTHRGLHTLSQNKIWKQQLLVNLRNWFCEWRKKAKIKPSLRLIKSSQSPTLQSMWF